MMLLMAFILAAVGLFLSAFFSGSETGFYRATRVRLVLESVSGDWIARGLLWLTAHPSLFVATTLVGNNVANYLTSLAIVIATGTVVTGPGHLAEVIAPLVLAPVIFVYGELLPKNLFLHAPNRLLRLGGPLFLACVVLFAPVSLVLWGLNWLLARFIAEPDEPVQTTLARRELRRLLEEGHAAGILRPSQRSLAQGIFAVANVPVARFAIPLARLPRAREDMTRDDVLRLAGRYRMPVVPVESSESPGALIGYYSVIELGLINSDRPPSPRPLMAVPAHVTHLSALMRMRATNEPLAKIVGEGGKTIGVVTAERLQDPLLRPGR
jgi:CBS domain containing-hemolysin-like protein